MHPLHSVEQPGEKQGCRKRVDQASTSESDCEKCSVRSEVAMSDGERGVAMGPWGQVYYRPVVQWKLSVKQACH